MSFGILQIVLYLVLLALIAKPLGSYMAHVYRGERTFMHPVLRPVERFIYRVCAVDEQREMGLRGYTVSLLVFNFVVLLFIYAVLRLQGVLPLNPAHIPGMNSWDAFNTAVSFATNTNWQAVIGALLLVSQGVVQNLDAPTQVKTLQGAAQVIGQGPVASQEIIKELGTNGGGFFNANSAHPFENPTPLTNLIEMLAILAIPVAFTCRREVEQLFELAEELGGKSVEVEGDGVVEEVLRFAQEHRITFIVLGQSRRSRRSEVVRGSRIAHIIREVDHIDVLVVADPSKSPPVPSEA